MTQHRSSDAVSRMRVLWVSYRWIVPAAVAVAMVAAIIVAVCVLRAGKPRPDWCRFRSKIEQVVPVEK